MPPALDAPEHMRLLVICLALLPLACGGNEDAATEKAGLPHPALDRFALKADPGAAISVIETKEKGSGEEVTVVGRLNRIVKGFATFNLVDTSVPYCGEEAGKKCCDSPWDYC